jgi:hypothetical protein
LHSVSIANAESLHTEDGIVAVEYVGSLIVEDASGARFQLHEYRGTRFFKRVRDFVLDTGDRVKWVDVNRYQIVATGEMLRRVSAPARHSMLKA